MLEPDPHVALLPGRPPLNMQGRWWSNLCLVLFRPIIILWLPLRQKILERRVHQKLDELATCRHRADLERLLGKPAYAVAGDVCDGPDRPDMIECYESEGCCIDLWFKDGRLVSTSGFVKPTPWEVLLAGAGEPPD
ncbi:MAG: hypothetical protein JXB62_21830 [Pirellulales bacterium]|nr:hypothetical protein [Pirellulales bacterium]